MRYPAAYILSAPASSPTRQNVPSYSPMSAIMYCFATVGVVIVHIIAGVGCAEYARRDEPQMQHMYELPAAAMAWEIPGEEVDWDLEPNQVRLAVIMSPDSSRANALVYLYTDYPDIYASIPNSVVAAILVSALQDAKYVNGFGTLDRMPNSIGVPGKLLVRVGDEALPLLIPLLDDFELVHVWGWDGTIAVKELHRRADYAFYYVLAILGEEYDYDPSPQNRAWACIALKRRLEKRED